MADSGFRGFISDSSENRKTGGKSGNNRRRFIRSGRKTRQQVNGAANAKKCGRIGKSIDAIFGGEQSENRKSNDIFKIVREISPEKIKTLPFIYLDCDTEDFLFQNNRDFVALLLEKKIPHEFRQLPGKHDWKFWDAQVQEFLELSDKYVK